MPNSSENDEGMIRLFRMIPDCPAPQRADRSAGGMLPTRAFRYCDPVTTASAFGWWVFPPFAFSLQFDGTNIRMDVWYWRAVVFTGRGAVSGLRELF